MGYKAMEEGEAKMNFPKEVLILLVRITTSAFLVKYGLQILDNSEGFAENTVAKNFPFLPGPPIDWTYLAAYMEIIAPVFLALGVFARLASFGLLVTMVFANAFHILTTGQPIIASVLGFIVFFYFLLAGPGKLSLAQKLY